MTTVEKIRKQGMQQGIQQGKEEGAKENAVKWVLKINKKPFKN